MGWRLPVAVYRESVLLVDQLCLDPAYRSRVCCQLHQAHVADLQHDAGLARNKVGEFGGWVEGQPDSCHVDDGIDNRLTVALRDGQGEAVGFENLDCESSLSLELHVTICKDGLKLRPRCVYVRLNELDGAHAVYS